MDKSGLGVYETAGVEVDPDGGVRAAHRRRLVRPGDRDRDGPDRRRRAERAPERIEVIHGDTDLIPDGVGSWSSRSTVIGGSAVLQRRGGDARQGAAASPPSCSRRPPTTSSSTEARVHVTRLGRRGPRARRDRGRLRRGQQPRARRAPGLGAREIYVDPMMNYPYGVALCQLELDPSTGAIEVERYFVAYEVGRAVNPMLLRGQIVGRRRPGPRRRGLRGARLRRGGPAARDVVHGLPDARVPRRRRTASTA